MDLNSLNQSVLRLIENGTKIISFLKDFTVGSAKDVSITYINADGSESVKTFPNIAKMTADIRTTIKSEMRKVIFVDEVNGDNNNSGTSSSSPIKDIHRALDLIPSGGKIDICLLSDCSFSNIAYIDGANIRFLLNGFSLRAVKKPAADGRQILHSIVGNSNTVYFDGNNNKNSKFVLPAIADGETVFGPDHSVFVKTNGSGEPENNCIHFGYGVNIEENGDFYIASVTNSVGSFSFSGGNLINNNGSARGLTDLVSGVVKDANGVPRNIQSNIEF